MMVSRFRFVIWYLDRFWGGDGVGRLVGDSLEVVLLGDVLVLVLGEIG